MTTKFERSCQQLNRSSFSAQDYTQFVAPGISLDDALSFSFWQHVIRQLRLNDLVTLIARDGSFDVTARVIGLTGTAVEFRILREWRPELDEIGDGMSSYFTGAATRTVRDHIAVIKNPEEGATKWVVAKGSGSPLRWHVTMNGNRQVCAKEAVANTMQRGLGVNLTISPAVSKDVLANPDVIPSGYVLTVLCPETKTDSKRWAIVNRDKVGSYKLHRTVIGKDMTAFLDEVAGETSESKTLFWLRPDMSAAELLSEQSPQTRLETAA